MTELDADYICVDLDSDWWVKIVNNYGIKDFLNIKGNLRDKDNINSVEDIFDHLILPPDTVDPFGNTITWEIADRANLYSLNELPPEYFSKDFDPLCCFSYSESEYYNDPQFDNTKNYFDNTILEF